MHKSLKDLVHSMGYITSDDTGCDVCAIDELSEFDDVLGIPGECNSGKACICTSMKENKLCGIRHADPKYSDYASLLAYVKREKDRHDEKD